MNFVVFLHKFLKIVIICSTDGGMVMKILEQLRIDDLKTIETIVSQYDSIASLKKDLKQAISEKKDESRKN